MREEKHRPATRPPKVPPVSLVSQPEPFVSEPAVRRSCPGRQAGEERPIARARWPAHLRSACARERSCRRGGRLLPSERTLRGSCERLLPRLRRFLSETGMSREQSTMGHHVRVRFRKWLAQKRPVSSRPGPGVVGPAAMDQFTPYPVTSLSANQRIGGFRCALFFRRCSSSWSTDRLGWRTSVSPNTIKISPCCPSGLSVGGVWKSSFSCQQSLPDERIVSPNSDEFWMGLFVPWLTYVYHA
jgi:hypothetical protein